MLIGTGLGILTGIAIVAGSKDRKGDFASPFAVPLATAMGGMLVGHLFTTAKITIPLHGKSSREKAEIFRQKLAENKRKP